MEASSDEEEADFVKQSKARHRRRLCDRWRCKTQGHSYCYVDSSSLHTGLTADDLEHWVDQLVCFDHCIRAFLELNFHKA
jgi:hypothetical protein